MTVQKINSESEKRKMKTVIRKEKEMEQSKENRK